MPKLPGVNHLDAVRALEKAGFRIIRQGKKHIVMSDDTRFLTIPRSNPVNASTEPEPEMDASNKHPSLKQTIKAVTDAQLHHYNTATLGLMKQSMTRWAEEGSTPERPVTPYVIQISFRDIQQPERRRFFNRIPTSFSLSDEQVDRLIETGRELLRQNPDFQQFLSDLSTL